MRKHRNQYSYLFLLAYVILPLIFVSIGSSGHTKPVQRSLCVFDVVGKNGPVYNSMKKYQTAALQWDVQLELIPYTDETVAKEDFEAGQCDGVVLTGVRNRKLVKFAGSMDMMGALPTYDHLKKAIKALSKPKAAKLMQTEKYEVAGIFPAGAVYFFVRPEPLKSIEGTPTVKDFAGKKVAVMSYDQQAITSIRRVGATVVSADVTSFSGMFNNGSVDVCYAPAAAYKALELYKGLGEEGRIVDYPLAQVTYQITLRKDRFPEKFAGQSREFAVKKFDKVKNRLLEIQKEIPDDQWMQIPEKRKPEYRSLFREVRQDLKEKGVYDPKMVTFLRKIRCSIDPSRAECSM